PHPAVRRRRGRGCVRRAGSGAHRDRAVAHRVRHTARAVPARHRAVLCRAEAARAGEARAEVARPEEGRAAVDTTGCECGAYMPLTGAIVSPALGCDPWRKRTRRTAHSPRRT